MVVSVKQRTQTSNRRSVYEAVSIHCNVIIPFRLMEKYERTSNGFDSKRRYDQISPNSVTRVTESFCVWHVFYSL